MAECFRIEDADPLARDILKDIWDRKPLYIRGGTSIFFYGCPCGKEGSIVDLEFRFNITEHRWHVIKKLEKVYGVLLDQEALQNGSGRIRGLASHVKRLLEAPRTLERKARDEAEIARLRRLQDDALREAGMGTVQGLSPGGSTPDRPRHHERTA